ncbi:AraC family transcriptional regulator N-terminal domain-containing protein [Rhizobium sp. NPDC090279]|uniref:AraC family transcriptional regulator n=1 Tax=Rhizobium sp. NPDC090279 TaxID=3364499 RepID=UPI00383ACB5A
METAQERLIDLLQFHCRGSRTPTLVPGLTLFRSNQVTKPVRSFYDPRLCIVLQGRKQILVGHRRVEIGPEHYLVVVIDVPVSANVVEAEPSRPHLSLTIDLDAKMVAEAIVEGVAEIPLGGKSSVDTATLTVDILEPVERLVRLLDRPGDIKTLAPLIHKELYYRLLQGELGAMVGQLGTAGSRLARIAGATAWISTNFRKSLKIEELASEAGMSVTSFHRNFKAATSFSPLQFRTRLRLHEARRQIMLKQAKIGTIAFDVGYENQSQFNREYKMMFGVSPREDALPLEQG